MKKTQSTIIPGAVGDLEVRFFLPQDTLNRWAVISHPHPQYGGTMDNKVVTMLEKTYQSLGFGTVVFQFRGVGLSQGTFDNAQGEQADLSALVAWLRQTQSVEFLVLAGFSFGAYITLKQANVLKADHVVVVAPPVNLYDFNLVKKPKVPWVVILGSKDEVVPPLSVLDWALKGTNVPDLHWRSGASHFFHRQLVWLKKVVLSLY